MAEFVASCDGFDSQTLKASTPYSAALKFAEIALTEQAMDEDEFDVKVLSMESGKTVTFMCRAETTTHWVAARKRNEEGPDE